MRIVGPLPDEGVLRLVLTRTDIYCLTCDDRALRTSDYCGSCRFAVEAGRSHPPDSHA